MWFVKLLGLRRTFHVYNVYTFHLSILATFVGYGISIWMERNAKVFENRTTPNEVIHNLVMEHNTYPQKVYKSFVPHCEPSANIWSAPPSGGVKINSDASLVTEGWIGMGVVARDENGEALFAATH